MFQIVIVGDVDRPEFADVLHSVRVYPDSRAFGDLFALEAWVQTVSPVPVIDVILLLQSYSGEHPASVLERVRQKYPITPVVSVLGAWCEGELRTGWPLVGTHRIAWSVWAAQGEKELFALGEGKFSLFALPSTYKDEEILLEQMKRQTWEHRLPACAKLGDILPSSSQAGSLRSQAQCWVFTCRSLSRPDFEMCRMLQMRMQHFGFVANVVDWCDRSDWGSPPEMILWAPGLVDGHSLMKMVSVLRELREKLPQTKIILQANSLRVDEIRILYENGADMMTASS